MATPPAGFLRTDRRDLWWAEPMAIAVGFTAFAVYATWAAFQGENYEFGPYLSPFYSPFIKPAWLPTWLSPALLILWGPLGFRATCYYYRKAYYRAYFADPVACAVGEPRVGYRGETSIPFILQNVHRFFFYVAVIFIVFLWFDAAHAFFWSDGFHVGVGTIVLTMNAFLLSMYTFSCHSCRHLVGGGMDRFSGARYTLWTIISKMNEHHMIWAWTSLVGVGFADLYVRLLCMGVFTDVRLI